MREPPYFWNHTSYDFHLWYTSVKGQYLVFFLHFFKILIFGVNSEVKEHKLAQNDKKLSVPLHIAGSTHMIVIFDTQG